MLCRICGTPIKAGEKFCSLCGEKVEVPEEIQQSQAQQPYSQQPDNRQPYGRQSYRQQSNGQDQYGRQSYRQQTNSQQSYGQSYGQPYGRQSSGQSYGQPYGRQSSGNIYYSVSGKSRKGLWITLGLVAVLAAAAVLMFNVFGDKQAVSQETPPPQKTLPFKGDTVQTKFANDTAKVIYDALDIFGNVGIDTNELSEQPFDMKLDMTIGAMREKANARMDIAYDNETLGMNINAEGNTVKIALIDDVLYMDMLGSVTGLDLNSAADLSKPMTLIDRVNALAEGFNLPQSMSIEDNIEVFTILLANSPFSGDEYTALTELLLSSINESCYESSSSKTTLTLHADDLSAILRTFAMKLDADEELKKKYVGLIKAGSKNPDDVIRQFNDEADALDQQKDSVFELVWEVSYKNEKPVSFEIKLNDGNEEDVYSFGYEKNGGSTDIMFEYTPGNSSPGISGACKFKKADSGTELEGSLLSQGQIMTFYGNIDFSGNNTHGTITMNAPNSLNTANTQGAEVSVDFNITVNIGMPDNKVKDDRRFKIDTSGATIIDGSSMLGIYGLPGTY